MEQERAYREQEEQQEQNRKQEEIYNLQPQTTEPPTINPSILGRAVGMEEHDIEAYGSIPSTQTNTITNVNKLYMIMDKSELTCPYYEQFNTKTNAKAKCETQNILTSSMNVLTIPVLDHLPGSLRIGDRPGLGGPLPGLRGGEDAGPAAAGQAESTTTTAEQKQQQQQLQRQPEEGEG